MRKIKWLAGLLAIVILLGTACGSEDSFSSKDYGYTYSSAGETVTSTTAEETEQEIIPETQEETQPPTTTEKEEQQETNSRMVWIPKTGKKYHSRSSCSGMKGPSQVTIERAQQLGYTACKKCW